MIDVEAGDGACHALALECRQHEIVQALVNVLSNAVDAARTTSERRVRLGAEITERSVRLFVSDPGLLDDPVVSQRMMEPFFTTKEGGMGLGLTVSRQLVEGHGGRLFLDGEAKTTTFVMELPRR